MSLHEVLYALAGLCFLLSTVVLALNVCIDRRRARAKSRRIAESERKAAEVLYPDFDGAPGRRR